MASDVKKAVIRIEADVKKAQADLAALKRKLRETGEGAKNTGNAFSGLGAKIDRMERSAKAVHASLDTVTKVLGGFGLAGVAVQAAEKLVELNREGERISNVMRNASINIDLASKAVGGTISQFELSRASISAARLGVAKTGEEFANVARIATVLGKSVGKDATTSLDEFVSAAGRGSAAIFDNFGLVIKANETYQKYAATLGKTASELNDAEKKQAILTEAMRQGEEIASKTEVTYSKQEKRLTDLRNTWDNIVRVNNEWTESIIEADEAMDKYTDSMVGLGPVMGSATSGLRDLKDMTDLTTTSFERATNKAADFFAVLLTGHDMIALGEAADGIRASIAEQRGMNTTDMYGTGGMDPDMLAEQDSVLAETSGKLDFRKDKPKRRGGGRKDSKPVGGRDFGVDAMAIENRIDLKEEELALDQKLFEIHTQRPVTLGQELDLLEQERDARLEFNEQQQEAENNLIELDRLKLEAKQISHESEMEMRAAEIEHAQEQAAEEERIHRERMARHAEIGKEIASGFTQTVRLADGAARAYETEREAAIRAGEDEKTARKMATAAALKEVGRKLSFIAAEQFANGIAAAANYRFLKATGHFSAAAAIGVTAAGIGAAGMGMSSFSGSNGNAGEHEEFQSSLGGGSHKHRQRKNDTGVPVSTGGTGSSNAQQTGRSAELPRGNVITVNFNDSIVGEPTEETGIKIKQAIQKADRSMGLTV